MISERAGYKPRVTEGLRLYWKNRKFRRWLQVPIDRQATRCTKQAQCGKLTRFDADRKPRIRDPYVQCCERTAGGTPPPTRLLAGLIVGLYAFSQIIYPLFSAWPRAKQLEREGKLIKPIPIATFIVAPIIWGALLAGTIWLVNIYFDEYAKFYYIALGFILIVVIAQIPKQNRDLEADFMNTWKRYLKER